MAASEGFRAFLADALAPLGPVDIKRMFGGAGLFADGLMFGLIADDTLFLKVDAETRPRFDQEGMGLFSYQRAGRPAAVMSYAQAPEHLLDQPEELVEWCRAAIGAARRSRKTPKPRPQAQPRRPAGGRRRKGS
ncbi:MAG: TfoX/Sxy family protein [Hyphomicrobiaceae bacterium]|nr:TfoX/Sxy family protein [Hyphomicrobiaceae bacterium]